jgi:hypothetical protein
LGSCKKEVETGFFKKKRKRHLQAIKVVTAVGCCKILLTKEDGAFLS